MKAAAMVVAALFDAALAWVVYWAVLGAAEWAWHPWVVGIILFFVLRAGFTFLMGVSLGQYVSGLRPEVAGIPGRLAGLVRLGAEIVLLWAIPGEFALLCQKRLTWAERFAQAPLALTSPVKVMVSLGLATPLALLLLLWAPALALNPLWPTMMPNSTTPNASATSAASPTAPDEWWHSAYFAFDGPMAANALVVPSFKILQETITSSSLSSAVKVFPEAIIMQPNLVARLSVQGSYFWPDFIPALADKNPPAMAAFFTKAFQKVRHPRLFKAWHWAAFAQAQKVLTKILPYPVPAQGQIITLGDTTFLRLHQDLRPLAMADRQAADILLPLSPENPTVLEIVYQSIDRAAILQWPSTFWPAGTKWNLAAKTNVEIPAEAFPPPEQFTVWQIFDFYMANLASTQTDLLEGFIFHYFYDLGERPLPEFAQEQVYLALHQLNTAALLLNKNNATAKFSPTYFKSLRDLEVSMFRPQQNRPNAFELAPRAIASQIDEVRPPDAASASPAARASGPNEKWPTKVKTKTKIKEKTKVKDKVTEKAKENLKTKSSATEPSKLKGPKQNQNKRKKKKAAK